MDRRDGHAALVELQLQGVGRLLGLHEDHSQAVPWEVVLDGLLQSAHLLLELPRVHHLLSDEFRGGTHTAYCDEDIVIQEVAGHVLHLPGKCRGEHHRLAWECAVPSHPSLFYNVPYLRLESHVKHAVSLIQDKELNKLKRHEVAFAHVLEAPGSGNQDVTPFLEVRLLFSHVGTTIDDATPDSSVEGKLRSLNMDLRGELARWRQDESAGHRLGPAIRPWRGRRRPAAEQRLEAGHHEGASLTAAGLRASHEVAPGGDYRDGVLLHGRGTLVAAAPEVLEE
mmetsp:Transcript_12331/g.33873  ORF Transcript_12331/g.33873 Transcript_12331/m.33873 type:complete len:282 (+) Transcript_12331:732-1577(+)